MPPRLTITRASIRAVLEWCLHSRAAQSTGVALAFSLVAAWHWQNDGLWLGDAPQHAINGLFWWDLVSAWPADPIEYALSYYARYPVINPVKYPPLFYLLEGFAFAAFGPSPHVAKGLVLIFGCMGGLYTMAWARRWIGPLAGWAGVFLGFTPGIVTLSNAVMLNVPAMALGLASLYHFRRWLETRRTQPLLLTTTFLAAVLMTYYPGIVVLAIVAAWALLGWRDLRIDRRFVWIGAAAACALVPLIVSVLLGPIHASRHFPSLEFLSRSTTWTFYWRMLPEVVGVPALVLGLSGTVAGLVMRHSRTEALYYAIWIAVLIVGVSALPARDSRYILLSAPACVIAAANALGSVRYLAHLGPAAQATLLAASLCAGVWVAAHVDVPQLSGVRDVAVYLQEHAPRDAVLYDGSRDGLLGFYLRASDPLFERRLVRADQLVYVHVPTTTFKTWINESHVTSTSDVIDLVRHRSGCRWVALEGLPRFTPRGGQLLLRTAIEGPEFEFVRSFPLTGRGERRIDLYRMVDPVQPAETVDLRFPSFTTRTFRNIVPITR